MKAEPSATWAATPRAAEARVPATLLRLMDDVDAREQLVKGFDLDGWRHEFRDKAAERDFTRFFQPEWSKRVVRMSYGWMVLMAVLVLRAHFTASAIEVLLHYLILASLLTMNVLLRWVPARVKPDWVVTVSVSACVVLAAVILLLNNTRAQNACANDRDCLLDEAHAHGLAVGMNFCVLSVYTMITNRKFVHFCLGIVVTDAVFLSLFVVVRPVGTGTTIFLALMLMLTAGLGWWNRSLDRFLRKEFSWYVTHTNTTRTHLEMMENAKRHKQRIVGYLFHEVRNPINNIVLATSGALQVLSDLRQHPLASTPAPKPLPNGNEGHNNGKGGNAGDHGVSLAESVADLSELVEVMYTAARSATHVLDDALNLEQLEAGNFTFVFAPFHLPSLYVSTMQALVPQFSAKGIKVELEVEEGLDDLHVIGDVKRLRQVLHNFLSNAAKFTPPQGRVQVKVTEQSRSAAEVVLCVAVSDTGVGIAPDDQQALFQPWSQIRPAQQQGGGGTGLGLSLSKDFIQRGHSGRIGLRSPGDLGNGSTFFFIVPLAIHAEEGDIGSLPATELESHRSFSKRHTEPAPEEPSRVQGETRVLVVDDSAVTLKLFGRMLSTVGVEFDTCENGALAVQKVREVRYALVFLDKEMPEMDGFQAARIIHKEFPHLPIVGVTGNALDEQRKDFLAAGATVVLPKPINKSAVVKLLEQFVA